MTAPPDPTDKQDVSEPRHGSGLEPATQTDVAPLTRVSRASLELRRARDEYRSAIVDARISGAPLSLIADAAGISRQAVSDILKRAS